MKKFKLHSFNSTQINSAQTITRKEFTLQDLLDLIKEQEEQEQLEQLEKENRRKEREQKGLDPEIEEEEEDRIVLKKRDIDINMQRQQNIQEIRQERLNYLKTTFKAQAAVAKSGFGPKHRRVSSLYNNYTYTPKEENNLSYEQKEWEYLVDYNVVKQKGDPLKSSKQSFIQAFQDLSTKTRHIKHSNIKPEVEEYRNSILHNLPINLDTNKAVIEFLNGAQVDWQKVAQQKIRRKSCNCTKCGNMTRVQIKYKNLPGDIKGNPSDVHLFQIDKSKMLALRKNYQNQSQTTVNKQKESTLSKKGTTFLKNKGGSKQRKKSIFNTNKPTWLQKNFKKKIILNWEEMESANSLSSKSEKEEEKDIQKSDRPPQINEEIREKETSKNIVDLIAKELIKNESQEKVIEQEEVMKSPQKTKKNHQYKVSDAFIGKQSSFVKEYCIQKEQFYKTRQERLNSASNQLPETRQITNRTSSTSKLNKYLNNITQSRQSSANLEKKKINRKLQNKSLNNQEMKNVYYGGVLNRKFSEQRNFQNSNEFSESLNQSNFNGCEFLEGFQSVNVPFQDGCFQSEFEQDPIQESQNKVKKDKGTNKLTYQEKIQKKIIYNHPKSSYLKSQTPMKYVKNIPSKGTHKKEIKKFVKKYKKIISQESVQLYPNQGTQVNEKTFRMYSSRPGTQDSLIKLKSNYYNTSNVLSGETSIPRTSPSGSNRKNYKQQDQVIDSEYNVGLNNNNYNTNIQQQPQFYQSLYMKRVSTAPNVEANHTRNSKSQYQNQNILPQSEEKQQQLLQQNLKSQSRSRERESKQNQNIKNSYFQNGGYVKTKSKSKTILLNKKKLSYNKSHSNINNIEQIKFNYSMGGNNECLSKYQSSQSSTKNLCISNGDQRNKLWSSQSQKRQKNQILSHKNVNKIDFSDHVNENLNYQKYVRQKPKTSQQKCKTQIKNNYAY